MPSVLAQLVEELNSGKLQVIDLTQVLSPDTPVIGLPPQFGASPGFSTEVISRYDDKGPAWYWSTIRLGEHTGTHFDAPIHWITGKDLPGNACDTIPPGRFVGPACVVDVTADVAENPDFLLTERDVVGYGGETVGTDAGQAFGFDPPFPAHTLLHGAGRFGLASLANL